MYCLNALFFTNSKLWQLITQIKITFHHSDSLRELIIGRKETECDFERWGIHDCTCNTRTIPAWDELYVYYNGARMQDVVQFWKEPHTQTGPHERMLNRTLLQEAIRTRMIHGWIRGVSQFTWIIFHMLKCVAAYKYSLFSPQEVVVILYRSLA